MSSYVEEIAQRRIGVVDAIDPAKINVLIDVDAPNAVALNAGYPARFPRVNSYVLIPHESGAVVGVIAWIGIERSPYPKRGGLKDYGLVDLPFPLRRMTVLPVGTLVSGDAPSSWRLQRGMSAYPCLGDAVILPSALELRAIVEASPPDDRVQIGTSPLAVDAPVSIDPDKLFGRHVAVLGNTGSGKSCSVAGLVRWSIEASTAEGDDRAANARFIVLDPNGEYAQAFSDLPGTRVYRLAESDSEQEQDLRVPAWMWTSHEWGAFAQATPATQRPVLMEALRRLRSNAPTAPDVQASRRLRGLVVGYQVRLDALRAQGPSVITNFPGSKNCGEAMELAVLDLRGVVGLDPVLAAQRDTCAAGIDGIARSRLWQNANRSGYNAFAVTDLDSAISMLDTLANQLPPDDPEGTERRAEDAPLPFSVRALADEIDALTNLPDFAAAGQYVATLSLRVRSLLRDQRLWPVIGDGDDLSLPEWLTAYIGGIDADASITVIDLSLVPSDVTHLVVSVISRLTFEALQRYRRLHGTALPTVLVLEEAHTFVHKQSATVEGAPSPARICRETIERISREGRKFGLGLVLSSQRPAELSPTVLAQCNTFLLHRLVNDQDQDLVARLVPDGVGSLLRELPTLPSRQAILLGWAAPAPVLVDIRELAVHERPRSSDPEFWRVWTREVQTVGDWNDVADEWLS